MITILLFSIVHIKSVYLFQSPKSFTLYNLEQTCGDGDKESLHLNQPTVFIFNSTVNKTKFPCHLELHLHSLSLGFSVFIETLKLDRNFNSDCSKDSLQFGRDKLFITTHTSEKYCEYIEHSTEVRNSETDELIDYDFKNVSYERREYIETSDNEMDVWINLEKSRGNQVKEIKLVVVPFRKSCNHEDEKYYRRCPGSGRCFKREYYCSGTLSILEWTCFFYINYLQISGMIKCQVLSKADLKGSCIKEADSSDFFYLPIIIIVTVVIIIATVIIGFAVKMLIKHFNDNGIHNIESIQSTSR